MPKTKKTEELNAKLAEMDTKMIEARNIVKLEIDYVLRKECGIPDQQ